MADPSSQTPPPGAPAGDAPGDSVNGSPVGPSARPRALQGSRQRLTGNASTPRSGRAFGVSLAIHVAVAFVVFQLLTFGHGFRFLADWSNSAPVEERLVYVEPTPTPEIPAPTTPVPPPAVPPPVASTAIRPSAGPVLGPGTPQPLSSAPRDTGSGTGTATTGVGSGNPSLRGATPGYTDGRVWAGPPAPGTPAGRNGAERLDSVISVTLGAASDSLDSIARASGAYGRKPGDWTRVDKDGRKWGWDNAGIRLGKVTIPNALLSLLPLNQQVALSGNSAAAERARRLQLARDDIQRMANTGAGDAVFDKLSAELRSRRERERRGRLRAPDASIVTAPQKSGGN